MAEAKKTYRHELKYLVSAAQIPLLKNRIINLMQCDPHTTSQGEYNIRSVYFDDYSNRCFYENENGTDPREKYRIRIYNHSSEKITLECKRKEKGKTHKTSCPLTLDQAKQLLNGCPLTPTEADSPLLKKFIIEIKTRGMKPVVIVEYDRIPYIYKNGNVRVTFDINISASSNIDDFFMDNIPKRPIMPVGQHLMEVKFDEFLPDFIHHNLNLNHLRQTNFSKYYLCRKFNLLIGR